MTLTFKLDPHMCQDENPKAVGLKTADHRRPPQTAPQTTTGQTTDHHRTRKI